MEFVCDLSVIEAIIRRHLPTCFRLDGVDLTTTISSSGNPALFVVVARFTRVNDSPEPAGWGHDLGREVRAGWDGEEFELRLHQLPSEFDETAA